MAPRRARREGFAYGVSALPDDTYRAASFAERRAPFLESWPSRDGVSNRSPADSHPASLVDHVTQNPR